MTTPNPETHKHLVDALCSGYVFDTYGAEALLKEYVAPLQELAEIGRLAVEVELLNRDPKMGDAARSEAEGKLFGAVNDYLDQTP